MDEAADPPTLKRGGQGGASIFLSIYRLGSVFLYISQRIVTSACLVLGVRLFVLMSFGSFANSLLCDDLFVVSSVAMLTQLKAKSYQNL